MCVISLRVVVAYFLYFTFGLFGIHHVFLRNYRRAFVYTWTLGGAFGIGLLCDLICIPQYVRDANKRPEANVVVEGGRHGGRRRRPGFGILRFIGEVFFGSFVGAVAVSCLPPEYLHYHIISVPVMVLAISLGVHTVGCMGSVGCKLAMSSIGAALPTALLWLPGLTVKWLGYEIEVQNLVLYCSLLSAIFASKSADWKERESRHPRCSHFCVFMLATVVMAGMVGCALYYNGTVTTERGEKIRIQDAIHNIAQSPAWQEFKVSIRKLYTKLRYEGLDAFFQQLSRTLDPEGEENAFKILGLGSGASEDEVKARYKELARTHHPDKVKVSSEEEREAAGEQWVRIQSAYDHLSSVRSRRMKKNDQTHTEL